MTDKGTRRETIEDRQRPSYVVIIRYSKGGQPEQIVKEMGPHPLWKAEKIDDGANINLNHEDYYTLILTREELDKRKADEKKKESP